MTNASSPSFNLLDEPWIPVRPVHGPPREVSLSELLLDAKDFRALDVASPPNLVALHRVLLAIFQRALNLHHGPWKQSNRVAWFREGLPMNPLRSYLNQWRDRFWVFHPDHPFMQVPALAHAEETKDKRKPWTQLRLESASGNAPTLFDHTLDDAPEEIAVPIAIRALLGFLQFTPGGLIKCLRPSDKAGPLVNTAAAIPQGGNLAESLLLGLHPFDPMGRDLPSWEMPPPTLAQIKGNPTVATGPNDRYSRLSRAVLFLPEPGGRTLRSIRFAAGVALEEDPKATDPMASYRINFEGKPIRMSFSGGRAVWRDLPSLLPDPTGSHALPAQIIGWATTLLESAGQGDAPAQVIVAGIASYQASLLRWRMEHHVLPKCVLSEPDAANGLREQLARSEDVFSRLRGFGSHLVAAAMPDPNHKDTKALAREIIRNGPAESVFFTQAERAFPHLMKQLAAGEYDAAHRDWSSTLVTACEAAWKAILGNLGASTKAIRAEARTYPAFKAYLNDLLPNKEKELTEATNE